MKKGETAESEDVLEFAIAVIDLYFRLEAITRATAGFAQAGGEFGVLRSLVTEGAQTVPQIANARPISRQHCQAIVNGLAAKALVEFIENPKHKKSKLVRATKQGHESLQSMREQFLTAAAVYAPHFTSSEVETATDVCRRARDLIEV